jgi:hypothetical protein
MNSPSHVATGVFAQMDGDELPAMEPYIDCNGRTCWRPKGEGERVRIANRQREYNDRQRHLEHVRIELEALRLDEIDPDWRDHFERQDAAALHYWRELAEYTNWDGTPKRVLGRP